MKRLLYIILCLSSVINAQESKGIRFVQGLSWQQVLEKAKAEKKYVFVDAYATWCVPCKRMDKEVYSNDKVGSLFNGKFVSVKVQMDTSKSDKEEQIRWYSDASLIQKKYKITNFPTFLFFSPDGEIVHRDAGFKSAEKFIDVMEDALNPTRQYYTLLRSYHNGNKELSSMTYLIKHSRLLQDQELSRALIYDYHNRLGSMQEGQLFTKDNVEFIASTIDSSSQKFFTLFYRNRNSIDSIMNKKGYADKTINRVIWKEIVGPFLKRAEGDAAPNWSTLHESIKRQYGGRYASLNELQAKLRWFEFNKNYPAYIKSFTDYMERFGTDTSNINEERRINNVCYDIIFRYSNDPKDIERAIEWMEGVVRRTGREYPQIADYPAYIDTYASLLYKAGNLKSALDWEEKALSLGKEMKLEGFVKDFEDKISKMKQGKPIWPVK